MGLLDSLNPEPDHVNEIGTKFWKDEVLTQHAQRPDSMNRKLNAVCWKVETSGKERAYLLVDCVTNTPIEEEQTYEGMACRIDVLKYLASEKKSSHRKPKKVQE